MIRHKQPRPWHLPSEANLREAACGKELRRVRHARDIKHWLDLAKTHARRCDICVGRSLGNL